MSKGRVLVAMSGGVDSSVAASLLVDQGYEVIGATMQVWDYTQCEVVEGHGTCCSSLDVDDARSVADRLNIPFYVLNCEEKFRETVIQPFIDGYLQGTTPVPCVNCNTFLKFDHLIRKMKELDCQYLATGHYAQIDRNPLRIYTSTDDWKDQTYFLFTLDPQILQYLLFPIGHLQKAAVRQIAEEKGLVVARKKDSTGICFVGKASYADFVSQHTSSDVLQKKTGWIKRYPGGEVMGPHQGIHHFTCGQGRGLGLDHHEKLFVIRIDPTDNTVWVGDEKYLFKDSLTLSSCSWLDEFQEGEELQIKIRYSQRTCEGQLFRESADASRYRVQFQTPQRAITPGQACVLYRGKQLLGGGWIQP